jgi:hypothetical protein
VHSQVPGTFAGGAIPAGLVGDLVAERRAVLVVGQRSSPTLILPVSPILISSGSWWQRARPGGRARMDCFPVIRFDRCVNPGP